MYLELCTQFIIDLIIRKSRRLYNNRVKFKNYATYGGRDT